MTVIQLVFYFFATVAVLASLGVVASSNPVKGALFLVLTFFAMAVVWMLTHAEFLAIILVLVYVGAVMTLFLFVVMMLKADVVGKFEGFVRYLPLALFAVVLLIGLSMFVVSPERFGLEAFPEPAFKPETYSNIQQLGMLLYTDYIYPFEIAAAMLLVAIVAAIALSHRKIKRSKSQHPGLQSQAKRADFVRIVKVPSEKKV